VAVGPGVGFALRREVEKSNAYSELFLQSNNPLGENYFAAVVGSDKREPTAFLLLRDELGDQRDAFIIESEPSFVEEQHRRLEQHR